MAPLGSAALCVGTLLQLLGAAVAGPHTISVFGSSVADGAFCSGNCSGRNLSAVTPAEGKQSGCYQSRLRVYQEDTAGQGRDVFNNCHGGDSTTLLLNRYYQLLAAQPKYVLIGLSLANEGIIAGGQPIFDHYVAGMQKLMQQNTQHGIHTYVGSNYANTDYNSTHYTFIKDMNILTQSWNVPSCNFLGTIDNGKGQWVPGFVASAGHPNNEGQTEMYHSIVPSIWDAIDAGKKPLPPKRPVEAERSPAPAARPALSYVVPEDQPIHSYAVVFRFKSEKVTSNESITLLAINATDLDGAEYGLTVSMTPGHEVCGWGCYWYNPAFTYVPALCSPAVPCPVVQCPAVQCHAVCCSGCVRLLHNSDIRSLCMLYSVCCTLYSVCCRYTSPIGGIATSHGIASNDTMYDDGEWHEAVLSHFWANQTTNLFVDGKQIGQLEAERVSPAAFTLAATTGASW
jgi:hypothetical protein